MENSLNKQILQRFFFLIRKKAQKMKNSHADCRFFANRAFEKLKN